MTYDAEKLIRGVAKAYRRSAQANSGKTQGSVGSGASSSGGSVNVGPASVPSVSTGSSGLSNLSALTNAASQIFSWF